MWNNETGICMNEKKGKKLNKDKGGREITLSCVVQIIGYDCYSQKPPEYHYLEFLLV